MPSSSTPTRSTPTPTHPFVAYMLEHPRRGEGKRFGEFLSRFRGRGMEVTDMRRWQPGDQKKQINRRATAKQGHTGDIRVNEYETERNPHIEVFLDITPNWWGGVDRPHWQQIADLLQDFFQAVHQTRIERRIWRYDWSMQELRSWASIGMDHVSIAHHLAQRLAPALQKIQRKRTYTSQLAQRERYANNASSSTYHIVVSDFLELSTWERASTRIYDQKSCLGVVIPTDMAAWRNYTYWTRDIHQHPRLPLAHIVLQNW